MLDVNYLSLYADKETNKYQSDDGEPSNTDITYVTGSFQIYSKCAKASARRQTSQFEIDDADEDSKFKADKKLKGVAYSLKSQVRLVTSICKKKCTQCSYKCTTRSSVRVPVTLKVELKSVDGPIIQTQDQTYSEPGYTASANLELLDSDVILKKVSLKLDGNDIDVPTEDGVEGTIWSYTLETEYTAS